MSAISSICLNTPRGSAICEADAYTRVPSLDITLNPSGPMTGHFAHHQPLRSSILDLRLSVALNHHPSPNQPLCAPASIAIADLASRAAISLQLSSSCFSLSSFPPQQYSRLQLRLLARLKGEGYPIATAGITTASPRYSCLCYTCGFRSDAIRILPTSSGP